MRQKAEWIGGLVRLPAQVDEGTPYHPIAILWLDTASGIVLDASVAHPDDALATATAAFERIAAGGRPARVRVADPTLAGALREAGIEVVVAKTPELDAVAAQMVGHFAKLGGDTDATYLEPGVSPADVGAMFAAAARLYRAAPWAAVPADTCIGVECAALGIVDGALTVVGQMGQSYGFSLLPSSEATRQFADAMEAAARGEEPDLPAHIMVSFEARRDMPRTLLDEIAKHRWEVAGPTAYPAPLVIEGGFSRSLTHDETRGVAAVMTALAMLVESTPDLAAAWENPAGALDRRTTIEGREVRLFAPLLWPLDEATAMATTLPEDKVEAYADVLLGELEQAAAVTDAHLHVAQTLILQAGVVFGIPFLRITPQALRHLMLEHIPRNVALTGASGAELVEAARHVLAIGERLGIETVRTCIEALAVPELAAHLDAALLDTARYTPTKAAVMEAFAAGVDLHSEEGLAAWLDGMARQAKPKKPAKKTPTKKTPAKKTPAKRKPRTKR